MIWVLWLGCLVAQIVDAFHIVTSPRYSVSNCCSNVQAAVACYAPGEPLVSIRGACANPNDCGVTLDSIQAIDSVTSWDTANDNANDVIVNNDPTPNSEMVCPTGYYVVGLGLICTGAFPYAFPAAIICRRPLNLQIGWGPQVRNASTPWAVATPTAAAPLPFACPFGTYLIGLTTGTNGTRSMGLVCATPLDQACPAPPDNNSTYATEANCSNIHQNCVVNMACRPYFKSSGGNVRAKCLNTALYNQTTLSCVDINECLQNATICGSNSICTNVVGAPGYICSCRPGYSGSPCTNNNECQSSCMAGLDPIASACNNCTTTQYCNDTQGGFTCTPYPNVCLTRCTQTITTSCSNCSVIGNCTFVAPGYTCSCPNGYTTSDGGRTCDDINECSANPCSSTSTCRNLNGSYACDCLAGYKQPNSTAQCVNIDECGNATICPGGPSQCKDTTPGYYCSPVILRVAKGGAPAPFTLSSTAQSPADVVQITLVTGVNGVLDSFAKFGSSSQFRTSTCNVTASTANNYTLSCGMLPGAGGNLSFSFQFCLNYSTVTVPGCVTVSAPAMLFSFPPPTLTPATLHVDTGAAGNVLIDADAGTGTVVTMSGTNFFASETSVFFGSVTNALVNSCQLQTANATVLTCIPQIALGENFTFVVVVGAAQNAQKSLPGTDLLTIVGDPPVLANITGCSMENIGCPTTGGIVLHVAAMTGKGNELKNPQLYVGGKLCVRSGAAVSGGFDCTLPPGTGLFVLVELRDTSSWFGNALSYEAPTVTKISSPDCSSESLLALTNCSNYITLYVEGNNFGASGATILVNSLPFPATHLSVLPGQSFQGTTTGPHHLLRALVTATAAINSLEVVQLNGAVSAAVASLRLLPCSPGYGRSGAACVACAAGTYGLAEVCVSCPDGTYQLLTGQSSCGSCPSGNVRVEGNCTPCGPGSFVMGNHCEQCPEGKYSAADANAQCLACDAGSFSRVVGSSYCRDCFPGTYSTANARECTLCSPGRASQVARTGTCLLCPRGTFQKDSGASSCDDCPVGTFNPTSDAPLCLDCPPGRFQNVTRQTSCELCAVGTAQDQEKGTACKACDPGTFAPVLGATLCEKCGVGHFVNNSGASACVMCDLGTAQDVSGSTTCEACEPGYYADVLGSVACVSCPPGYLQSSSGASHCDLCPAGSFNNKKASQDCELCQPGHFQAGVGQQMCLKCSEGWYQPNNSAVSCAPCSAGTASLSGATKCVSCLAARFSDDRSSVCLPCPPTSIQALPGQSFCQECTDGSSPNELGTRCDCDFGYYAREMNGTSLCPRCPKGSLCRTAGWTFPQLTTLRGYWRPSNESANIYRCNTPSFCLGNDQCGPNRRGPVCALCVDNYRSSGPGSECAPCPATKAISWGIAVAICLMLLLLLVAMYLISLRVANAQQARIFKVMAQQHQESQESLRRALAVGDDHFESVRREIQMQKNPGMVFDEETTPVKEQVDMGLLLRNHTTPKVTLASRRAPNFMYKVKILIGFFQISSYLPSLGDIAWPAAFVSFIQAFTFFNFDFIPWQTVGCAASINYFDKTIIVGFVPVIAALVLGICFAVGWLIADTSALDQQMVKYQKRAALWIQFIRMILFTVFLLYTLVSKITLGMYNCVEIEGHSYLVADFQLSCFDDQWNMYATIDGFFVAVYPIGIPLAYFFILRSQLARMNEPQTILMLGFLYEAYTQSAWYWELVDMTHKLILTSIIVYAPNEQRMGWNMAVMGVYLICLLVVKPYVRKGDDRFHLLVQVTLFSLAFVGFILQIDDQPYLSAYASAEQMEGLLAALLICIVLFLLGSFVVIAGRNILKIYRAYQEDKQKTLEEDKMTSESPSQHSTSTSRTENEREAEKVG